MIALRMLSPLFVCGLIALSAGAPTAQADPALPGAGTGDVHAEGTVDMAHLTARPDGRS